MTAYKNRLDYIIVVGPITKSFKISVCMCKIYTIRTVCLRITCMWKNTKILRCGLHEITTLLC